MSNTFVILSTWLVCSTMDNIIYISCVPLLWLNGYSCDLHKHLEVVHSLTTWYLLLVLPRSAQLPRKSVNMQLTVVILHTRWWKGTIKLMKVKALRKHSLHKKTAASVLLKLFISSNEWCPTTDAPSARAELQHWIKPDHCQVCRMKPDMEAHGTFRPLMWSTLKLIILMNVMLGLVQCIKNLGRPVI